MPRSGEYLLDITKLTFLTPPPPARRGPDMFDRTPKWGPNMFFPYACWFFYPIIKEYSLRGYLKCLRQKQHVELSDNELYKL